MTNMLNARKIIFIGLMAAMWLPTVASAQANPVYTPLSPLPCVPANGVVCGDPNHVDFQQYVQYIVNIAIAVAAAAAVFMITFGGFQYMTSASFSTKTEGLNKVKNAIAGLVLILCSYLLLRTIDPRLVAIPTTLVPSLHLQKTGALDDLFGNISSDATTYKAGIASVQNTIQTAKSNLDTATQQRDSIRQQISDLLANEYGQTGVSGQGVDFFCGFSGIQNASDASTAQLAGTSQLCKDLGKATDAVNGAQATVDMSIGVGKMEGMVAQCGVGTAAFGSSANRSCLNNQSQTIDSAYAQYNSQYLSPAQTQTLNAYYGFARNAVELNTQLSASVSDQNAQKMQDALDAMNANADLYAKLPGADAAVVADMKRQQSELAALAKAQIPSSTKTGSPCVGTIYTGCK